MSEVIVSDEARPQSIDQGCDWVLDALGRFAEPVTMKKLAAELVRANTGPGNADAMAGGMADGMAGDADLPPEVYWERNLEPCLNTLIDEGHVHRFSPYRSREPRFWNRSPEDYAAHLLADEMHGVFLTKSALFNKFKARVKPLSDKAFGDLLKHLVNSGRLHAGTFLGGRTKRFSASRFDAAALWENALEQIAGRCGTRIEEVREMVRASLGDTQPSSDTDPSGDQMSAKVASDNHDDDSDARIADAVLEALRAIASEDRQRSGNGDGDALGGAIVSLVQLRRFLDFKWSQDKIDAGLIALEHSERIDLTVHPDPTSLDEEQRRQRRIGECEQVYDMVILRR